MRTGIPFKRNFLALVAGSAVLFAGIADLVAVAIAGSLANLVEAMQGDVGYRAAFIVGGAAGILIGLLLLYIGIANLKVRFERVLEVERTRSEVQAKVMEARLGGPLLPP